MAGDNRHPNFRAVFPQLREIPAIRKNVPLGGGYDIFLRRVPFSCGELLKKLRRDGMAMLLSPFRVVPKNPGFLNERAADMNEAFIRTFLAIDC